MDWLSPYKGLSPFEDSELDASFFFGRAREQEIITANLTAARLTLLYGLSGVGKSSVLKAAVVRRLRELPGPLAVVFFDRWRDDPGARLREAVAEPVGVQPEGSLADTLDAVCARLGGELYVILDGVEEYFVYHEGEHEAGTFAADFPDAVTRPGLRAYFLLSLREDALAGLDQFKARIPSLFGNSLRLEHLDRPAAREAIIGPLEQYNRMTPDAPVGIEPELVEAVLDQVAAGKVDLGRPGRGAVESGADGARVETPYLSLVLERLWRAEHVAGSRLLRLSTLEVLGGAEQIVRDHLDDALAMLPAVSQEAAAEVFNHLVTPSGTKIAHSVSDLADYASLGESELEPMLQVLTSERILRPVGGTDGSGRYEIFHDVLADAVLAWRNAFHTNRELERERAEAHKRMRRLLVVVAVAIVALAAMAAVTVFALAERSDALRQRSAARTESRRALARELQARALLQLDVDPELSLLLALEAARREPTRAAETVLRQALTQSHVRASLRAGGKPVHAVFSPDGRRIATGGGDGTVRIFRVGGKLLRVLHHDGAVESVAFSTDGQLLVTASKDGAARIWRTADGTTAHVLEHHAPVITASFSPDGTRVVTAAADRARIWSSATGAPLAVLSGHSGTLISASFSDDGSKVLTVSADRTVRIWNGQTGEPLYGLGRPTRPLTSAAFSPDGTLVVAGSSDGTVRIWRRGRRVHTLTQRTPVVGVAFSPSGEMIVTARTDGAAVVWDAVTGRKISVPGGHAGRVTSASFSPNEQWVLTSSVDGTARVSKADTGVLLAALLRHKDSVTGASFSPDGHRVATASVDGTARVWDPGTASQLRVIGRAGGRLIGASFSPDGKFVVAPSADGTAGIWRIGRGRPVAVLQHEKTVTDASFSPDGSLVVTSSDDGTARLWTRSGRLRRTLHHDGAVTAASFSPDGARVVTASADRKARIWRVADGRLLAVLAHPAGVLAASFSPDGGRVLTACRDRVARIWPTAGGRPLLLKGHRRRLVSASFSHDGSKVVTASADDTARIWDARTGAPLHELVGHTGVLTSAAFSPDDRIVVTASRDNDARTWSVATGKKLHKLQGHLKAVNDASFSPDGRWIVTAGPTAAGLWVTATGRRESNLYGSLRPLTSATFSPDGTRILAAGVDGKVRMYRCEICGTLTQLVALAEKRLAGTGRKLTPAERRMYLHD